MVDTARAWVLAVLEMETFLREGTRDAGAWQDLLERRRAARERYYAAVRADLALPPGHPARRPLPPTAAGAGAQR